jgi:peptidoglycan/xylan/chitin deacetylase (PgdA/CDA1 family)
MVPVIYGDDPESPGFFKHSPTSLYLGIDVFGAAFFMLSQYEEIVKPDRDRHDRFLGEMSLAYQEGFLDRPIIDEYVEILWECLRYLWPELRRREHSFRMLLSHDLDWPLEHAFMGTSRMLQRCAGDLVRRHDLTGPFRRIWGWSKVKLGNTTADPCNNFASIMAWDERHGVRSAFYFIAAHTVREFDERYQLGHPWIRSLMREIHQRGHEIGLHTSYNTYCDPAQTRREFEILRHQCEAEGIRQAAWGGRQHYLRWKTPITLQNWNDAGLDYDSSLTFADRAGFRCGVCREFPGFNVATRHRLYVRERPLIVMECSVIDPGYMGLGFGAEAFEEMAKHKARCRMFAGDFTLLWHNSRLLLQEEIRLYKEVLAC